MVLEQIGGCFIAYNPQHDIHIREYYLYCVQLLKRHLSTHTSDVNVILGPYHVNFPNNNRVIKVDLQVEHTLVKEGGRSVDQIIHGEVNYNDNQKYLIRIPNYDYYNSLDYVIEYSLPNVHNISTNNLFADYLKKVTHIHPMLCDINFNRSKKTDVVCLFSGESDRRGIVVNRLLQESISIVNVKNCFSSSCLSERYSKTKILVNVHQTNDHHTFEELRVLPALLNGVIVVSEDVPLKEKIPYSDFIVWCDYTEIPAKVSEVYNNYEKYYDEIFASSNIKEYINKMGSDNLKSINVIK
jgi:hypothetical protein